MTTRSTFRNDGCPCGSGDMPRYARDFEDRLLHIAHERAQGQRG